MKNSLKKKGYLLSKFKEVWNYTYNSWISFRHTDQLLPNNTIMNRIEMYEFLSTEVTTEGG